MALQPCHMQLRTHKHTGMKGLFLVHSPKKTPCFCNVLWFLFKNSQSFSEESLSAASKIDFQLNLEKKKKKKEA